MSSKGTGSGDGHWVTINGNHVFIEDSSGGGDSGKDSGGTVLKGRVEKTGSPPQDKTSKPQKTGGGNSGGGSAEWEKRKPILATIAPIILEILKNIGVGMNSNMPHSYHDNFPEIQKQKLFMDNVIKASKVNLSQEEINLQKMFDDIFNMPKGAERDTLNQQFNQRLSEYNSAKSTLDRIDAFNQNDMFDKIPAELDKNILSDINQSQTGSNSSIHLQQNYNPVTQNNDDKFAGMSIPTGSDRPLFDIAKSIPSQIAGHPIPKYPISTEFAHNSLTWLKEAEKNPDVVVLDSVKDISNPELRAYLQNRITQVLHKSDCKGVFYPDNSEIAKRIANSNDFRNVLLENRTELLKNHSIMLKPFTFKNNKDLKNSLHNATIYKAWIDKDGNLHVIIYDIYDFDYLKNRTDYVAKINNQMYEWQNHHNIENYFVIIYVTIDKNDKIFQIFKW